MHAVRRTAAALLFGLRRARARAGGVQFVTPRALPRPRPYGDRLLTLVRDRDGRPQFYIFKGGAKNGRSVSCFIKIADAEVLEGADQAWGEIERVSAKPWPYYRVVRRVAPPER